jgi:hypothetical protein
MLSKSLETRVCPWDMPGLDMELVTEACRFVLRSGPQGPD